MNRALLILFAITLSACTPDTRTSTLDRSQFDVMRGDVNMDERALVCANEPQSVGFATSQDCFVDAQRLMAGG